MKKITDKKPPKVARQVAEALYERISYRGHLLHLKDDTITLIELYILRYEDSWREYHRAERGRGKGS